MRRRMTWNDGVRQRRASEHPAYPDEGPASPAAKPQPSADAYDIGGPSEFAEDPHPGPYPNGEHPAYPDEGPASPAYKAAALERKAAKCIRIATAMLGEDAGVAAIEDQALALMDLSDRQIQASLSRIAGDEEVVEEEVEEESKKKASSAVERRLARLERVLVKLAEDDDDDDDEDEEEEEEEEEVEEESKKKASRDERLLQRMLREEGMVPRRASRNRPASRNRRAMQYMGDEEAMLEMMLQEEGMGHDHSEMMGDEEAMLAEMMAEEGMAAPDMSIPGMDEVMAPDDMDQNDPSAFYSEGMSEDPMGVMASDTMGDEERAILAKVFGKDAGDKKEEKAEEKAAETIQEEVEHAAEEKKEESKKKASVRPQPKKASNGATQLGTVNKAAASEISDLSQLWESAPDVSKFF